MSDASFLLLQRLLPKRLLTDFAGLVARAHAGAITAAIIRRFVRRYQVDMQEAVEPDVTRYASFNDFFTRALRADARPLAHADFVCPVDGAVSQLGRIEGDGILQAVVEAKQHRYSLLALLAGDQKAAETYRNGHFTTIYLSPRDYHRIHMPCAGTLERMVHVPGTLYSVNPATARGIGGLFARNERVICYFRTPHGPMVMVLVGATIVGSMATVWHGVVSPPRPTRSQEWVYVGRPNQPHLAQGEAMGRFLLGSTVIVLWPAGPLAFNAQWRATTPVRLGEEMAQWPRG